MAYMQVGVGKSPTAVGFSPVGHSQVGYLPYTIETAPPQKNALREEPSSPKLSIKLNKNS